MAKIAREKLMTIIDDARLKTTKQSSFTRCELDGCNARIYVSNSKMVDRVDLSGFTINYPGVDVLSDEDRKNMKLSKKIMGQLNFSNSEDVVLAALTEACSALHELSIKSTKEVRINNPIDASGNTLASLNFDPPIMRGTRKKAKEIYEGEPTISKDERRRLMKEAAERAAKHAER